MGIGELMAISIGVSMDAFAIAICKGLSVEHAEPKHLLSAGLWFGGSQAIMPLLGYVLGSGFRSAIESLDHWVSFVLLAAIGIHMLRESRASCSLWLWPTVSTHWLWAYPLPF